MVRDKREKTTVKPEIAMASLFNVQFGLFVKNNIKV